MFPSPPGGNRRAKENEGTEGKERQQKARGHGDTRQEEDASGDNKIQQEAILGGRRGGGKSRVRWRREWDARRTNSWRWRRRQEDEREEEEQMGK